MKSLTEASLKNNRVSLSLFFLIIVGGICSFLALPRAEDPGFLVRKALVKTFFPGASPERVELLVTDKIEEALQEIPEVKTLESESRTGVSLVFIDLDPRETDLQPIWDRIRRKVSKLQKQLPQGIIGPEFNDEYGEVFGIIISLYGDSSFQYNELLDISKEIRKELLLLDEVAKVQSFGVQEERIYIEYDNAKLARAGITPFQIKQLLESQNIIIPGGSIQVGKERWSLEPGGNFSKVEDIQKTALLGPLTRQSYYLEDFARVYRDYASPPQSIVHSSGKKSLALALSMRENGNILKLGSSVKEKINELRTRYPIGLNIEFSNFQPDAVQKKVNDFVVNVLQSILIVVVVMLLTLGLKTGFLVSCLIPLSMLMSLLMMRFFHIGLDQVSLASLIIALGMLVDNAIVIAESILLKIKKEALSTAQAAIKSCTELKIPLLTSALTTSAAFLPIYLAESETGEYTAPLFKVVTITLLSSWILSLTILPLFFVKFIGKAKTQEKEEKTPWNILEKYKKLLNFSLKKPLLICGCMAGLFIGSILLARFVPKIFFPPQTKPS